MILVATVLTVYGIETETGEIFDMVEVNVLLQQYLPFTVLKPIQGHRIHPCNLR